MMPLGARLRSAPGEWPILQCSNVFVLPGVPQFFQAKLSRVCAHFLVPNPRTLSRKVSLTAPELDIVSCLNAAVAAHSAVTFGSYPVCLGAVKTVVTLESPASAAVEIEAALSALIDSLPPECIDSVEGASRDVA